MAKLSRIALIANGDLEYNEVILSKIRSCNYLIAVDGGVNHCHKLGLRPDVIIGDLDSASPEFLAFFHDVHQKKYPKDKDQTDLELAIEHALEKKGEKLTIFGGCGKRIDHTLSNINLLSRYPGNLFLETGKELLFVIDGQVELKCQKGQTISLIPLNGPVSEITTRGLKWELDRGKLDKNFFGISNVCLSDEIRISVGQGDLLCVLEAMEESR